MLGSAFGNLENTYSQILPKANLPWGGCCGLFACICGWNVWRRITLVSRFPTDCTTWEKRLGSDWQTIKKQKGSLARKIKAHKQPNILHGRENFFVCISDRFPLHIENHYPLLDPSYDQIYFGWDLLVHEQWPEAGKRWQFSVCILSNPWQTMAALVLSKLV